MQTKIKKKLYIKNWFKNNIPRLRLVSKKPFLDLETLLLYVLKKKRVWLIENFNKTLFVSINKKKMLNDFLNRKIQGEPLEYILEECFFWSMKLKIKKKCLSQDLKPNYL